MTILPLCSKTCPNAQVCEQMIHGLSWNMYISTYTIIQEHVWRQYWVRGKMTILDLCSKTCQTLKRVNKQHMDSHETCITLMRTYNIIQYHSWAQYNMSVCVWYPKAHKIESYLKTFHALECLQPLKLFIVDHPSCL